MSPHGQQTPMVLMNDPNTTLVFMPQSPMNVQNDGTGYSFVPQRSMNQQDHCQSPMSDQSPMAFHNGGMVSPSGGMSPFNGGMAPSMQVLPIFPHEQQQQGEYFCADNQQSPMHSPMGGMIALPIFPRNQGGFQQNMQQNMQHQGQQARKQGLNINAAPFNQEKWNNRNSQSHTTIASSLSGPSIPSASTDPSSCSEPELLEKRRYQQMNQQQHALHTE